MAAMVALVRSDWDPHQALLCASLNRELNSRSEHQEIGIHASEPQRDGVQAKLATGDESVAGAGVLALSLRFMRKIDSAWRDATLTCKCKSIFVFYQCVAAVPSVFNVSIPHDLHEWAAALTWPSRIGIDMLMPGECFYSYVSRLLVGVLWPFMLMLVVAAACAVWLCTESSRSSLYRRYCMQGTVTRAGMSTAEAAAAQSGDSATISISMPKGGEEGGAAESSKRDFALSKKCRRDQTSSSALNGAPSPPPSPPPSYSGPLTSVA
eukprot:6199453-Pleurochrysis_carterae.AAC.2